MYSLCICEFSVITPKSTFEGAYDCQEVVGKHAKFNTKPL